MSNNTYINLLKQAAEDVIPSGLTDAQASAIGALIGAGIGGLGGMVGAETDPNLSASKRFKQRLKTAIIAAGLGAIPGAGLGFLTNAGYNAHKNSLLEDANKETYGDLVAKDPITAVGSAITGDDSFEMTDTGKTLTKLLPYFALLGLTRGKGLGRIAGVAGNTLKGTGAIATVEAITNPQLLPGLIGGNGATPPDKK